MLQDTALRVVAAPAASLDDLLDSLNTTSADTRIIAVDPLSMIDARTYGPDLSAIVRRLKVLALDRRVSIIGTACAVDSSVTQYADTVIEIYRPDQHQRDDPRSGEADLRIRKNADGPTAVITVPHELWHGRFICPRTPV